MSACSDPNVGVPAGPAGGGVGEREAPMRLRVGESGVELRWWVVDARRVDLAAALESVADEPVALDAPVRARLRANGLRMLSVPMERLGEFMAMLPAVEGVQRVWLGQATEWSVAVRGPEWSGARTLLMDGAAVRLGPGSLRLLARSWTVPVPPEALTSDERPEVDSGSEGIASGPAAAALELELAVQHEPGGAGVGGVGGREIGPDGRMMERGSVIEAGPVFSGLRARVSMREARAYIIVGERAGDSEGGLRVVETGAPTGVGAVTRSAREARPGPAPSKGPPSGPASERPPTPGEALLMSTPASRSDSGAGPSTPGAPVRRAVLVFVPYLADRYELLPSGR